VNEFPPPADRRAQPAWETAAILLAIAAIWPALLNWGLDLHWPAWLTWGLLLAALAVMVVVFIRRIRRLSRLVERGPGPDRSGPTP